MKAAPAAEVRSVRPARAARHRQTYSTLRDFFSDPNKPTYKVGLIIYWYSSLTHSAIASCATFFLLPHVNVICDLLLE